MNIEKLKPIHKALKALQNNETHADDSFYPSYITDKKQFLATLETVDCDCNDFLLMRRAVVNSGFFQGRKSFICGGVTPGHGGETFK